MLQWLSQNGIALRTSRTNLEKISPVSVQNRDYSKRKEFAPSGSKFLSFKSSPYLGRDIFLPLRAVHIVKKQAILY